MGRTGGKKRGRMDDSTLTQGGIDAASDLQEAIAPIVAAAAAAAAATMGVDVVEHVEEGATRPGEERSRDVDHRFVVVVVVRTAAAAATIGLLLLLRSSSQPQIEASVPSNDRGPLLLLLLLPR